MKRSYYGKRKIHDQNPVSNYRMKPKIIATSFSLGKNMIMLYLKNQNQF
ncbi:hypothetical protein [Spiroplasma poulsonii]|nr:hypothetical protein [Spiroplasma poulsonii]UNF62217.1 hypothetical protein MNU24_01805 [Spiroplasma poulsonii]